MDDGDELAVVRQGGGFRRWIHVAIVLAGLPLAASAQPPSYSEIFQQGVSNNTGFVLAVKLSDDGGLGQAILSTNETGTWINWTGHYGSPWNFSGSKTGWAVFAWRNATIAYGTAVGWRVWFNDSNQWNSTAASTFTVGGNSSTSAPGNTVAVNCPPGFIPGATERATIPDGIAATTFPGERVVVCRGTYPAFVVDRNVRLISEQGFFQNPSIPPTIIDGSGGPFAVHIFGPSAQGASISNFTIRNTGGGSGIIAETLPGCVISNNTIVDADLGDGVRLQGVRVCDVRDNTITDWTNGVFADSATDTVGAFGNNISRNTITGTANAGIWAQFSDGFLINDNTITDVTNIDPAVFAGGIFLHGVRDSLVVNNTVLRGGAYGLFLFNSFHINLSFNTVGQSTELDILELDTPPNLLNTGTGNSCSTTSGWNDAGTTGCTFPFVPPPPPPPAPPSIVSFSPPSPIADFEGAGRTFSLTTNQVANVTWLLNGTVVQTNTSALQASYTNLSAVRGNYNVTAFVSSPNGTTTVTWLWRVFVPHRVVRVGLDVTEPFFDIDLNSQIEVDAGPVEATACRIYTFFTPVFQSAQGESCASLGSGSFLCTANNTPEGGHTRFISCINAFGLDRTINATWTTGNLGEKYRREATAIPSIVTLQGRLTFTNGTPITSGSLRVTVSDSLGTQVFQDLFNNSVFLGALNVALGAKKELRLVDKDLYSVLLEVDVANATFTAPTVTFGTGVGDDVLKFQA